MIESRAKKHFAYFITFAMCSKKNVMLLLIFLWGWVSFQLRLRITIDYARHLSTNFLSVAHIGIALIALINLIAICIA